MAHNLDELTNLVTNLKESAGEVERLEAENQQLRDQLEQATAQAGDTVRGDNVRIDELAAQLKVAQERADTATTTSDGMGSKFEAAQAEITALRAAVVAAEERALAVQTSLDKAQVELAMAVAASTSKSDALGKTADALVRIAEELRKKG